MIKQAVLSFLSRNSRVIRGGVLLLLAVFVGGALLSYDAFDPSFNRASSNDVQNIFGYAGSYIADPIMQFIGIAAAAFVMTCFVLSLRSFVADEARKLWLKSFALAVAIVGFSACASVVQEPEGWPFYVSMGGLVGDLLRGAFEVLLTNYGFIAASVFVGLTGLYFALGIKVSEVKAAYAFIKKVSNIIKNVVVTSSMWVVNFVRKLLKKDALVKEAKSRAEAVAPSVKDGIVELKESKPVKRRVARQASLKLDPNEFELPDFDLLSEADPEKQQKVSQQSLQRNAELLKKVLNDFGVKGEILKVKPGPVVTLYELEPSPGTKASRVVGLADDIARSMSAISARISVIPGRNVLGIELPNLNRETVYLRELMETEEYRDERIKLPVALGKDIGGESVMVDLARMPHLLIAGTTGSGKSVAVNAMILSYLYRLSPEECRFIMIDPKMLELSVYDGIPHLLSPVVTEPKKAIVALNWAVREMEDRYRAMSNLGVRNISGYNKKIEDAAKKGEVLERTVQTGFDPETGEPTFEKQPLDMNKLPFIVVIVDEMADLMLTAGKEIEASIQRLAQMARAAGIHMVMATQRPSVDVITGVIKANFPTRISFQVTSRIDSRTILGEMGAEQLLGMGDMLYMSGGGRVTRVHGPFVDDKEVELVVKHLKAQGKPDYKDEITMAVDEEGGGGGMMGEGGEPEGDSLYDKAVAVVIRDKKVSTSYVQRQLRIGYNKAANLIDQMEAEGVISPAGHSGKRQVLAGQAEVV